MSEISTITLRTATTAQINNQFVGTRGEIVYDSDKNTIVVLDGTTIGGHPLAKADTDITISFTDLDLSGELNLTAATNNYIDYTDKLTIRSSGSSPTLETSITAAKDGAVELYYNGTVKITTTTDGVSMTGRLLANTIEMFDSNSKMDWARLKSVPSTFAPSSHNHDAAYSAISHTHSSFSSLGLGTLDVSGNTVIQGNLTVNGTTTTVDSNTITVDEITLVDNKVRSVGSSPYQCTGSACLGNLLLQPNGSPTMSGQVEIWPDHDNEWFTDGGRLVIKAGQDAGASGTVMYGDGSIKMWKDRMDFDVDPSTWGTSVGFKFNNKVTAVSFHGSGSGLTGILATGIPASVVHDTEKGALHATDALRISGNTVSLYKGDGTSESVTVPDNNTWRGISDSTSLTSSSISASQKAVKSAYDKGNHSHPYAASSHTHTSGDLPTSSVVTIYSSTTTFLSNSITLYQNSSGLNFTPHIKVNGNSWGNPLSQHLEAIVGSNSWKSTPTYPGTSYQAGWRVERDGGHVKGPFYGRFAYKYMTVS